MNRLRQLLGYLGRDGVVELVLGTGRQIAIKADGNYKPITAAALTSEQLHALVVDSPLAAHIPASDSNGSALVIAIESRTYRVQIARRGEAVLIKIELAGVEQAARAPTPAPVPRAPTPAPVAMPAPRPVAAPTPTPALQGMAGIAAAIDLELSDSSASFDMPAPAPVRAVALAPAIAAAAPVAPAPATPVAVPPVAAVPALVHATVAAVSAAAPVPLPALGERGITVPPALVGLVKQARQRGASDLHIASSRPAMLRVIGELVPLGEPMSDQAVQAMLLPLLSTAMQTQLADRGYADFAIDVPNGGRLRANVGKQREGYKGSFRLVIDRVPTLEDLGLPKDLAKVTSYHQGLVVIAGPNGHGKTTTLAALVNLINASKPHHILTVEDPVEVFHPRKMSLVSQREVGTTTRSFATALKASLREDPDVIVIGELRDRETVEIALTAAETGHLVIATMSTPSAAKTIDRLIDMFPPDDQSQVRASLAGALRFIVAQRLLPNIENNGVVPVIELLTGVLPVAVLIRDNKLFQLPNVQQRGRSLGMIRFDDSLIELARAGRISEEVAVRAAESKKEMLLALNPAAAAVAAAAPPGVPNSAAKGMDNIKSKIGGLFGKKDKE
ncbi:MAG: PilT/PilU family type 4a pilus ATPase [Kofleriaceae bacterium]|nr:PilT/PilU family type 4a pilus ATPase [Kofleriaceae bacterium]